MLSLRVLKSANKAAEYYTEAVNYYQNDATAMRWLGKGAEHLGLSGKVDKETLLALLNGELPTGETLGKIEVDKETGEKIRKHRPGVDMTLSAPKSLSVLAGLKQNYSDFFLGAHDDAVKWTFEQVEREFASTRVKEGGLIKYVKTGNLTIAACRHPTSRSNDPAIHTHGLVLNFTFDDTGKACSLASDKFGNRGVIEAVGRNTVYIGALYRYKLAEKLIKAGFTLELTSKGLFEIAGFPKEVLAEFSKRREEIEAYLDDHGLSGPRAQDFAALETRKGKSDKPLDVLVDEWRQVVGALGHDPLSLVDFIKSEVDKAFHTSRFDKIKSAVLDKVYGVKKGTLELNKSIASDAIEFATRSISEKKEVFNDRELKAKAIEHLIGKNKIIDLALLDAEIEKLQTNKKLYIHDSSIANERKIATVESIKTCARAIELIHEQKDTVKPLYSVKQLAELTKTHNDSAKHSLTKSQHLAISKILTSSDRVVAVQGYAGTGKTTMLKLSKELAELNLSQSWAGEKGYTLKGITVATSARNELIKKASIDSDVFDAAINKIKCSKEDLSKTIYIVDESSMISTSQAHELISLIIEKKSRLVFVGDRAQLQSVNEGLFFEMAQTYGMDTAQMTEILRQSNPSQKQAAIHASRGEIYDALKKLERVSELDEHDDRVKFFANAYLDMSKEQREHTLLFAAKHKTIKKITDAIRVGLKNQGELHGAKYKQEVLTRLSISNKELESSHNYMAGNIIKFTADINRHGIAQGDYLVVEPITRECIHQNTLILKKQNGRKIKLNVGSIPKQLRNGKHINMVELYAKSEVELHTNEKIMFTKSDNRYGIANSDTATVTHIDAKNVTLSLDSGEIKTFPRDSEVLTHLSHGYVMTNYKVQGKDKFAGLAFIESSDQFACDLSNFYVQITRAVYSMSIVTDDKNEVIKAIELANNDKPSVLNFASSQELAEVQEGMSQTDLAKIQPKISNVISITKQREKEFKESVVDLVNAYRAQKELSVDKQSSSMLSKLAFEIIHSKEAYRYAQSTLKYSYQAYRFDAIDAHIKEKFIGLEKSEREKLDLVGRYIQAKLDIGHSVRTITELKEEENTSNEIKNKHYKALFDQKLNRNQVASKIAKDIDGYIPYLGIYSIGELNRMGVPQHKYDEESQAAKDKLVQLSGHAEEYLHYQTFESYLIGTGDKAFEFAYSLLENKQGLAGYVFHFAEKHQLSSKEIYWKIYGDASKHKEKLFKDDLTVKEKVCFEKVKAYRENSRETAKIWAGVAYSLENSGDVSDELQSSFTLSSMSRDKLASQIQDTSDFKKALEFFKVDPQKLEKHSTKHTKREIIDGLFSLSSHTLKEKLIFTEIIAKDFKSFYPMLKENERSLKKLYAYSGYLDRKNHLDSLDPAQQSAVKSLSNYQRAARKSGASWKHVFSEKENNRDVFSTGKLERAVYLSAKRDYLASLVDLGQLDPGTEKIFRVKPDTLTKHQGSHASKVSELEALKGGQKKLLSELERTGATLNKQSTAMFNRRFNNLISCIQEKEKQGASYHFAFKALPLSHSSLAKKYKEIASKFDISVQKLQPMEQLSQVNSTKKAGLYYDLDSVNEVLLSDISSTYSEIFGQPKSINSREMRYSGGLIVSLSGGKKGSWYDFSEGRGGWVIQAIEKAHGLSTKDAIKHAAEMAMISPEERTINSPKIQRAVAPKKDSKDIKNRIVSAKSMWENSVDMSGTLAETYLKKHRGIDDISRINARFMPEGAVFQDTHKEGGLIKKTNKTPCVVFPATDEKGKLTAVERVFLDKFSGKKNSFMSNAKLGKGVKSGSATTIQQGNKGNALFIAEGPETATSIANAFPDSTVLSSMGIYNIKNLTGICKKMGNTVVVFASDNDGLSKSNPIEMNKAMQEFESKGFSTINFKPEQVDKSSKIDWNDIHISKGISQIREDFYNQINVTKHKNLSKDYNYYQEKIQNDCAKNINNGSNLGENKNNKSIETELDL